MTKKDIKIEDNLNDIQQIVDQIEQSDVDLKKSLTLYEEAIRKSKCILEELEFCEEQFNILNHEKESLSL